VRLSANGTGGQTARGVGRSKRSGPTSSARWSFGLKVSTPINRRRRSFRTPLVVAFCPLLTGCPAQSHRTPPPRPIDELISAVNAHRSGFDEPLYSGSVALSASLKDEDGARHLFDLHGQMALKWPRSIFLRLDHTLESGQLLLGSNDEFYWLAIRKGYETMWWGRHELMTDEAVSRMPLDPRCVADALGMRGLPRRGPEGPYRLLEPEFDRLLVPTLDRTGRAILDRAYRVDRWSPNDVREIAYFDDTGAEFMVVRLTGYAEVGDTGKAFPRRARIEWPRRDSWMTLTVSHLETRTDVHAATFRRPETPPDGIERMVNLDLRFPAPVSTQPASDSSAGESSR
jgi:hypothetical protein